MFDAYGQRGLMFFPLQQHQVIHADDTHQNTESQPLAPLHAFNKVIWISNRKTKSCQFCCESICYCQAVQRIVLSSGLPVQSAVVHCKLPY